MLATDAHHHPRRRSLRPAGGDGSGSEANGIDYIFGLAGTKPLKAKVEAAADAVRTRRALEDTEAVRTHAETTHRAKSWGKDRRVVARIEATRLGLDIRFIVTSLAKGSPAWLYESLYCARGQAENLIKLHKSQLASDRTSCRSPLANQSLPPRRRGAG